jgi:probable phosphomutase (TIGR03848 family)
MSPRARPSRPTLILLVRHGHTPTTGKVLPGRAPGLHLSETGEAQARSVVERVRSLPTIDAIYSSPLERARETAAPVARARGVRVRTDRSLVELDTGDWTGKELAPVRRTREWRTVQEWPSGFRFPGGESFLEMQDRMVGGLDRLRQSHPGEVVLAFSHADPIKAAVAHALGTHLDLFQRIVISPCSITAVAYGRAGPHVMCVNSTGELAGLQPS